VIGGALLASRLVMLAGMTAVLHGIPAAAVYMAGHFADADWYHAIAAGGYAGGGVGPLKAAFYPGYPLLAALVAAPFRVVLPAGLLSAPAPPDTSVRDWLVVAAQLLVSNACLVVALVALWKLYRPRLGSTATLIGSCLLVAAPNAFFLSSGHSESAFLAATALAFLMAERGRWVPAGVAAAAAALIRAPGILLLVPLAIIWLRSSRPRGPAVAALAIALAGAAAFPVYTWVTFGDPLRYVHSEAYWHASRANPIATYVELLRRLWLGVREALHVRPSPIASPARCARTGPGPRSRRCSTCRSRTSSSTPSVSTACTSIRARCRSRPCCRSRPAAARKTVPIARRAPITMPA